LDREEGFLEYFLLASIRAIYRSPGTPLS